MERPLLTLRHTDDEKGEVGLDEAGRGCFWGPLMAGAVLWPPQASWTADHVVISREIRDSKKISPKKRERIADAIQALATYASVGSVSATEIDTHGVTWANQEAFRRALKGLPGDLKTYRILLDGELSLVDWDGDEQHCIVEGDSQYISIAAASILAKVTHDRWVQAFCDKDAVCAERYGLRTSKGYGTEAHRNGLVVYGAHAHHRRTFIGHYVSAEQALEKPVVVVKGYMRKQPAVTRCLIKLD